MRSVGVTFFGLAMVAAPMVWSSGCGEAFHEAAPSDSGSGKDATSDSPIVGDENTPSDGLPTDTGPEASTGDATCDPKSCGLCDHLCETGGMCTSNVCTYPAFASMLVNPSGLAVDAGGQVLVGVNGDCGATSSGGSIARYSSGGAKLSPVASGIVCDQALGIIVATNAFGVYWATSNNVGYAPTAGSPKTYSPPSGRVVGFTVDDKYAYVAVDSGSIYYASTSATGVASWSELAANPNATVGAIASAGGSGTLYWADQCALDCTSTGDMTGFVASSTVAGAPGDSAGPSDMNAPTSMGVALAVSELFWLDGNSTAISETPIPLVPEVKPTTYSTLKQPLRIAADTSGTILLDRNGRDRVGSSSHRREQRDARVEPAWSESDCRHDHPQKRGLLGGRRDDGLDRNRSVVGEDLLRGAR